MKNWRAYFVLACMIIFTGAIVSLLAFAQIINHDLNKALAQGQQKIFNIVKGERGDIFFKDGEILATNVYGTFLFISPVEIEDGQETAKKLSDLLNLEEEEILKKTQKETLFEKIKEDLTDEEKRAIEELNLPGVYCRQALFRSYPQEEIASQLVGFVGGEGSGQYGIEEYYEDILQGKELVQKKEKISLKSFFSSDSGSAEGSDMVLTIDYNVQFIAEELLKRAKEDLNIESGQIIVVDPKTGRVVALANYPNFNPNEYFNVEDFDIFQNPTFQKLFEPGSGFKPITIASAVNENKISPQTVYEDTGRVEIGEYTIVNYNKRIFGQQTMTGVLEKSINTGAVYAERKLGHDLFLKYIDLFGLFEKTGIDLAGEVFSANKIFKRGYEINFATASFGQGIEITPMQLIKAYTAIANKGKLATPYVVDKIIEDGKEIKMEPEISSKEVISPETASQTTAMLISVIENGYSKSARIPGYYIAGKTGTAQIPWPALGIEKRGYSDKTWQSFIGFAPALNPRFLILVKLDNPKANTAEYSALPVFRELAKYLIDYWQIPPDH